MIIMMVEIKLNSGEVIKLNSELVHLKDCFIRLRELCIWYRNWAKEKKYSKGIYQALQKREEWKEARRIHIKISRDLNHIPENKYLRCSECLKPTAEWNLVMHHKEYDWDYLFEQGIQLICRSCNNKIHGKEKKKE